MSVLEKQRQLQQKIIKNPWKSETTSGNPTPTATPTTSTSTTTKKTTSTTTTTKKTTSTMSKNVRTRATVVLEQMIPFRYLDEDNFEKLLENAEIKDYQDGEKILSKHDKNTHVYVIMVGKVNTNNK